MSITIKLDTTSLRDLIAANPEFKLEITRAVMNNIRDDVTTHAVTDKLGHVLDSMVEDRGWGSTRALHWRSPQFQKLVLETVADKIGDTVQNAAVQAANDWLNTTGRQLLTKFVLEQGEAVLDQVIPDSMIQELLEKKVQRVFAAMAGK